MVEFADTRLFDQRGIPSTPQAGSSNCVSDQDKAAGTTSFQIPSLTPASLGTSDLALKEVLGFNKDERGMSLGKWPHYLFHAYRTLLFIFVLGINIWWDHHIIAFIRDSGRITSGFHLDNSVLISLVTTSVANFLALVAIIARNLFANSAKTGEADPNVTKR